MTRRRRPGHDPDPEGIAAFCREHLAHFKVPRYICFVDSYPTTASGKVQKFKLRERAAKLLSSSAHTPTTDC